MPTNFKFGKRPKRTDNRTLRFSKYLTSALPPIPSSFSWIPQLEYGVMLNDSLGDCTCAAVGHAIQIWTKYNFDYYTAPDGDILTAYKAVSGYNGNEDTDNGADMLTVASYWKNTGVSGHKILGYAEIKTIQEIKAAVYLFGLANIGFDVPNYLEDLFDDNTQIWDVAKEGQDVSIAGGHDVIIIKFDDVKKLFWFVSWGEIYCMTYAFFTQYTTEAYANLSPDWISKQHNSSPIGFDLASLQNDLSAIENV